MQEPTPAEKREIEQRFVEWCIEARLDPQSTEAAVQYERWWEETFPPGEEDRW